jgi:hypothetical protein
MGLKGKGRELAVSVRLGFPINNMQSERTARLEIHDETASIMLMEIELSAEQLMALLGNSAAHTTAWMPVRLDHVGKRMETDSTVIGKKWDMTAEAADAAGIAWAFDNGWEQFDIRSTNTGEYVALGRRWVDPGEEKDGS